MIDFFDQKHILKGDLVSCYSLPEDDAYPQMLSLLNDQKTMQYLQFMLPGNWSLEAVKMRYDQFYQNTLKGECLNFFVFHNETKKLIADIGFTHIDLRKNFAKFGSIIDHQYIDQPELYEMLALIWNFGFEKMGFSKIYAVTFEEDAPTHYLAMKLGVPLECVEKDSFYFGDQFKDSYIYSVLKEDWPEKHKNVRSVIQNMSQQVAA